MLFHQQIILFKQHVWMCVVIILLNNWVFITHKQIRANKTNKCCHFGGGKRWSIISVSIFLPYFSAAITFYYKAMIKQFPHKSQNFFACCCSTCACEHSKTQWFIVHNVLTNINYFQSPSKIWFQGRHHFCFEL